MFLPGLRGLLLDLPSPLGPYAPLLRSWVSFCSGASGAPQTISCLAPILQDGPGRLLNQLSKFQCGPLLPVRLWSLCRAICHHGYIGGRQETPPCQEAPPDLWPDYCPNFQNPVGLSLGCQQPVLADSPSCALCVSLPQAFSH